MRHYHWNWPIVFDPSDSLAYRYGLFGKPTTVVIDQRGRIAWQHAGRISNRPIAQVLHALLAGLTARPAGSLAAMKVVSVVGNRPQFIKAAPLAAALAKVSDHVLVHTGQHYDAELSQIFFDELGLRPPDHEIEAGSGSHAAQTAAMLVGLEPVLAGERPDLVLVYGDTNSTLAGSLVAAKLRLPLGHVESGLRSFDRAMPEEVNRVVADVLSDLRFCPSQTAVENLAAEGISDGVHLVGDVMVDVARTFGPAAPPLGRDRAAGARAAAPMRWSPSTASRTPPMRPCPPWSRCSRRSAGRPSSRSIPAPAPPSSAPASSTGPRRRRRSPRRSATSSSPPS